MSNAVIYALCEPDTGEVRYIGKTCDLRHRLNGHVSKRGRQPGTYRAHWIASLMAQGARPTMKVLEQVTERTWQEAERYWIAFYTAQGANLTNTAEGGGGGRGKGFNLSAEHKRKIGAANKGKTRALAIREAKRAETTGRAIPKTTRDKMSVAQKQRYAARPELRARVGFETYMRHFWNRQPNGGYSDGIRGLDYLAKRAWEAAQAELNKYE